MAEYVSGGNGAKPKDASNSGLENLVGLSFERKYTNETVSPYDMFTYEKRSVKIVDRETNKIIYENNNVEVPSGWGQPGTDILASKYFRRRGIPEIGAENSIKQVVHRVIHTIRTFGEENNYFQDKESANAFEDELAYLLLTQRGAFNSPVLFNCGLYHNYGITGSKPEGEWGNWSYNLVTGEVEQREAYVRPQSSGCFIQKIRDDMTSIFSQLGAEALIFKYGSGTGTNFSSIRGEGEFLSGGGTSSGLISFLKVFDAGAGATKSGGTTRRAAKMVILDIDHPEIEKFIKWKANEEKKVAALVAAGYSSDYEGEAYKTVTGQNANNSVRLTDKFIQAVINNEKFQTIARTTGEVWKEYNAKDLWDMISEAAWQIGDPGLQFDDAINKWHTCKNSGRINASNPCSEYMFLDDSSCNLASINLKKFLNDDGTFNLEEYKHACELFITAQEILVDLSSYPRKEITKNTHNFRPLGLGYANLGGLLMQMGFAYDSEEARAIAGALTAITTATAYAQSAKIANGKGPFAEYEKNKEPMQEVIHMHNDSLKKIKPIKNLEYMLDAAKSAWVQAVELGEKYGYRNSQTTLLAPTGTIGLLMECDTTGIEPDTWLIKYKKLAGGGTMTVVNNGVPSALKKLGYNDKQIGEITKFVLEKNSIEGAPHLSEKHYSIFDCANKSPNGTRFISPMGHVLMMEAVQPFLSGAISKTVNMPYESTQKDIEEIYMESWKRGLKAIALYRDNCKLSQPLNSEKKESQLENKIKRGDRERLPAIGDAFRTHAKIGGHSIIVKTGEYEDGRIGEIYVHMYQDGSSFKSALDAWAISISKALQFGMPLEELIRTYKYTSSEPNGIVEDHPYIKMCSSVYDFVMTVLGVEYLGITEMAHIKPDPLKLRSNKQKIMNELLRGKDIKEVLKNIPSVDKAVQQPIVIPERKIFGDGPMCPVCHHPMIRTGKCHTCTQCGTTGGCS